MRFERLLLTAYGPFTDLELDLSGGAPGGLHVIYGANEAGKSTSLRAVTSLLFGIGHRTGDAYLHPTNKLSLSAVISAEGERHFLTRVKRRKDTLLGPDGQPLSVDPLPALLGNLDEESFTRRFGLDQGELERGAEALLGGSEQGLFAAGTAGSRAREVLSELLLESSEIYLPRGKVKKLNRALLDYEQAARDAKRAERPPEKWLEQERASEQARAEVLSLRAQRNEVRAELRHLNRLRSVLSDLNDLNESTARLQELAAVPELSDDVTARRESAQARRGEAHVEVRRIGEDLQSFEREIAELPAESPLSEVDEEPLSLATRVGTALSARKDLPKRQASLLEQCRQIGRLLSEMGRSYEEGQELQLAREALNAFGMKQTLRRLLAEKGALSAELDEAVRTEHQLRTERERAQLEDPGETLSQEEEDRLSAAVFSAHSNLARRETLQKLHETKSQLESEAKLLRAAFSTTLSFEELAQELPKEWQLREIGERFRSLESRRQHLLSQEAEVVLRRSELEAQLSDTETMDLPSEQQLGRARQARDLAVTRAEQSPLPEQFEHLRATNLGVDSVSDRLRFEADRIARALSLKRQVEALSAEQQSLEEARKGAEKSLSDLKEKLKRRSLSLGVPVWTSPVEAESACAELSRLTEVEKNLEVTVAATRRHEAEREECVLTLERALGLAHEGLALDGLTSVAEQKLRDTITWRERLKQAKKEAERSLVLLGEAKARRRRAEDSLTRWEEAWGEALVPFGLPKSTSPARVEEVLLALEKIDRIVGEATNLEGRIFGMRRDTEALSNDVLRIAKRHAPEMLEEIMRMDEADAAAHIQEKIRSAKRTREERARLKRLIEERRSALSLAAGRLRGAQEELDRLCVVAGVLDVSELPKVEEDAREAAQLREKKEVLHARIREKSEGTPLSELHRDAQEWQGSSRRLRERVDELDEQAQVLEEELRAAESRALGMELGLLTYRSEDVVVAREQAAEAGEAALLSLREYLVLRAAHTMLDSQIKLYAERFSGPIARRASEIFERLTLGRYQGLRVSVGESSLRCMRAGAELEVSELSRGTRAQLYLALRLSSLETYFKDRPAVPLVFDDLFVDFDDDRTTAAFEVLSDMAQNVQILYFTHLARDVEAAENAVASGRLFQHRIASH